MAAAVNEPPLIVILGPTASGKTAVALDLASELGGEIICADSRTVYTGLNIGTAKPTLQERARVPHHLLDVVTPNETYTVARFQADARAAIKDICARGNVPFLVGGSGLYIDSVVFNYAFTHQPGRALRASLEAKSLEELFQYSIEHNIKLPDNKYNKRYVIRAIEKGGINTTRLSTPVSNTFIVGITTENTVLKQRIAARAEMIFINGVVGEAQAAAKQYGWDCPPLQAPAYRAARQLLDGVITRDEAIGQLAHSDWQLARKQMTWFRRNRFIKWLALDDVKEYVRSIIAQ